MSSHQYMTSSVVHGSPSDHFSPLRKWKVNSFWSALTSHFSARPGPMSSPSLRKRVGDGPYMYSNMHQLSDDEMVMCTSPPYLPLVTQLCGTTYGFSGSRSSTFGSFPDLTRSASIGASVNDDGFGSTSDGEPLAPVAPACPSLAPGVLPASSPQLASSIVPATAAAVPSRTCRRPTSPGRADIVILLGRSGTCGRAGAPVTGSPWRSGPWSTGATNLHQLRSVHNR